MAAATVIDRPSRVRVFERPERTHETTAEQTREAMEGVGAGRAGASIRDRMVDIGRGNQQAGRQGS
jgi:hypothetical protein